MEQGKLINRALEILEHDLPDYDAAIISKLATVDLALIKELFAHYGDDLQGKVGGQSFVSDLRDNCRPKLQTKVLSIRAAQLLDELPDKDDTLIARVIIKSPGLHAEIVEKFGQDLQREFDGMTFSDLVRGYWLQMNQSFLDFSLLELEEEIGMEKMEERLYCAKKGGEHIWPELLDTGVEENGERLINRIQKDDRELYDYIVETFADDLMTQFPQMAARAHLIYHANLTPDQNEQVNLLLSFVRTMGKSLKRIPTAQEIANELAEQQPDLLTELMEEGAFKDIYTMCLSLLRHFEEPAMYAELRDLGAKDPAQQWVSSEFSGSGGRGSDSGSSVRRR